VASQFKVLESEYLAHKLAHALAGCVAGAAASGTCKDGAIGAAMGEIVAQLMPPKNGIAYSEEEKRHVLGLSKLVAGDTSAYAGGNAQTAITMAETAVQNNALLPALIGLAWLADKAWTAYEVSQDVAAIRDGTRTLEQVAADRGADYINGIILGNVARYGIKGALNAVTGKWEQTKDPFSNVMESRGNGTPKFGANGGVIQAVDGAIPNAGKAVIDPNKLTSYALNPLHPVGGDKARVFESALGYNQSNAAQLIGKIQQGALTNPAVMGKADQFGQRFTVDMPITGPNGNTVVVRTGWVLDPGATIPRLATAYVK
jgi:hypothetical protein